MTVAATAEDATGNALGAPYAFSFTTRAESQGMFAGGGCMPAAGGGSLLVALMLAALAGIVLRRGSRGLRQGCGRTP